ncbi:MAG: cellulase family glycosylhydrolase [Minicystis sp.]
MRARGLALLVFLAVTSLHGAFACSGKETASTTSAGTGGAGGAPPSGPPCSTPRFAAGRVSVQCEQLVDPEGRVVFLHGVNARVEGIFDVTFDDGRTALEPIPKLTAADAQRMREVGFNAVRLPINWSGLEPKDGGGFDEAYVDRVAAAVAILKGAGLRVLVDFHQDAYSKEIGEDGAPLWAIRPPPTQLLQGPLTDLDARRTSPQVLAAFSTFFGDKGADLRTRFAAAVAHVAQRFADEPAVVGIEIFNEPLPDSDVQLDRLHDEVIAAIRKVDPGQLAFFEPSVLRNFSDHASPADRDPWPGTVYAPHVYTLAFSGTDAQHQAMTKDTLQLSNKSARNEAKSWKAPLAITEFGYAPDGIQADNYLAWQTEWQDEYQASAFFWLWKEQSQGSWGLFDYDAANDAWTERDHVRKALARVAPEAVAGWPTSFAYDRAAKRFQLDFTGDPAITAPSRIHVPAPADFAPSFTITCDGAAVTAARDPASGVVEVPCGGAGAHTIVIAES